MAIALEKLKLVREELKKTQLQMAEELGIPLRTYRSYETGEREMSTSVLLKFCTTFNVSADDILGNFSKQGEPYQDITIVNGQALFMIPIYRSAQEYNDEFAVDQIAELFDTKKEAFETIGVRVTGDAMAPKIEDRDIVIVHKQSRVRNEDIIAATVKDRKEILIRRYLNKAGVITLEPINMESEVLEFNTPEDVNIIGIVKKLIKAI